MEEDQELRFVCKLCNKRYPCGKSLGGHMRSHVIANSAESDDKLEPNVKNCKDSNGYGLRENPKKTWRVSVSNSPLQQEQICKQCGKGFQSLKALCGHMACHSERDRVLKDDHSWTSENQKLVMDSHSDTEVEAPRRPKRAASMRYKRIIVKSSSLANGSCVSEIDHEQEEVAMCLMMLSRDSSYWVGVNSVAESSDNNSVVLGTKSSSIDMRIGRKKGLKAAEIKKLGKGKLKCGVLDSETLQFENSDSGYFMNGPKKVDSDVSLDGFLTNDNFKKQKVEGRSRFEISDAELGKKCKRTELWNGRIASNSTKYNSSKIDGNSSYNPDLLREPCKKKMLQGHSSVGVCKNNAPKRSKYESSDSKKKQTDKDLSCNGERRLKLKKSKGHECPICHRVFKSGQALGGHKRSHFLGGSQERSNQTQILEQELSGIIPDLLDLNLPAPAEGEENEHAGFMQW